MRRKQPRSAAKPLDQLPSADPAVSGGQLATAIERAARFLAESDGRVRSGIESELMREQAAALVTEAISAAMQQTTQTVAAACDGDIVAVAEILPAMLGRPAALRIRFARSYTVATLSLPTRMPDGWLEAIVRGRRGVKRVKWSAEYGPLLHLDCVEANGLGETTFCGGTPNEEYAVLRGSEGIIILHPLRAAMDELDPLIPYTDEERVILRGDDQ